MPEHTHVDSEYHAYVGRSDVFSHSDPSLKDLRPPFLKITQPKDPCRQAHFECVLLNLAEQFGSQVPTFLNWNGSLLNRMDKGCIGHAIAGANPLIVAFQQNDRGTVTHINLRTE